MSHQPVMLEETVAGWVTTPEGLYLDLSFGAGGHSLAAAARLTTGRIFAFDADPVAVREGQVRCQVEGLEPQRLQVLHGWASEVLERTHALGIAQGTVAGLLFDTGLRLEQYQDPEKGFSFRYPEAYLDMRLDANSKRPTAAELLNTLPEAELERIFREYGGDRQSRTIAASICRTRAAGAIETVAALSELVLAAHHRSKVRGRDARTLIWQALRMAVNDEVGELVAALAAADSLLAPGGRLVVLTFESTLDRIVKSWIGRMARKHTPLHHRPVPSAPRPKPAARFRQITRKPLRPSDAEVEANPRARSARLRIAERTDAE